MLPSWQEMIPILILLIIIFGARKLPEIGSGLGKGIKEFKKAMNSEDEKQDKKPLENESSNKENSKTKEG